MSSWFDVKRVLPWLKGTTLYLAKASAEKLLEDQLISHGFFLFKINGQLITDEKSFFMETARALEFPPYFGFNWNAFIDCLGDLENRSETCIAIIWKYADRLLQEDLGIFLEATFWLRTIASDLSSLDQEGRDTKQILVFLLMEDPPFA